MADITGQLLQTGSEFLDALNPLWVIIVTVIVAKLFNLLANKFMARVSKNIKVHETQFLLAIRFISALIYFTGFIVAGSMIPELQSVAVSIFASAGILAIVVGFAAQQTLSNFISGIFIGMFQPFRVGDRITIEKEYGVVEDITLRHTVIRTRDNRRVVVPNSQINDSMIINYTINDAKILREVDVTISYDSDIDFAKKILEKEIKKLPDFHGIIKKSEIMGEKDVLIRVVDLGEFGIKLRCYFWAPDWATSRRMKQKLLENAKKAFDREGVEIPYPYRTIVYKKDLKKTRKAPQKKRKTKSKKN